MQLTQEQYEQMWYEFKQLKESALTMSHYDLAETTAVQDPHAWKLFLMDPDVSDWIKSELIILQKTELQRLIQGVGDNSRSTGTAQLIATLSKLNENVVAKEGPVFIYTYVPLSSEQAHADNVVILKEDPFLK